MPRPETPLVTVDIVIELIDEPGTPIVLIERRYEPLGWALPGGFVDVGETCEAAAIREALEETGLQVVLAELLGVYSDPSRDPRGHTVSVVYRGQAHGLPVAADDAKEARAFGFDRLPPMAFDHATIIADYVKNFRNRNPVS